MFPILGGQSGRRGRREKGGAIREEEERGKGKGKRMREVD